MSLNDRRCKVTFQLCSLSAQMVKMFFLFLIRKKKGTTDLTVNRSQQHLLYSVSETSEIKDDTVLDNYMCMP